MNRIGIESIEKIRKGVGRAIGRGERGMKR
jgi:hypothetical protein